MNYGQLILDISDKDSETKEYANEIIHETKRVATIVKNLLDFSRQNNETHTKARIEDVIEHTLSLIRTVIKKDQIILEVNVENNLPELECRSQQLQQVIMNLMTNARDALNGKYEGFDDSKKLIISAERIINNKNDMIRITVEDFGNGIPKGVQDRIFEPFFTTKTRDKGTGLGLSISHGIIKDHNGNLRFETEENENTKFIIELPCEKED